MEQMQIDRSRKILGLCIDTRDVLGHLTPSTDVMRETYLLDEHLWLLEIGTVCGLVYEYYSGALACIEQKLGFPGTPRARSSTTFWMWQLCPMSELERSVPTPLDSSPSTLIPLNSRRLLRG